MPLLDPAYRLALGILLRPAEAEDAVQEAAFRAWRKIGNVRPGAEFRPWFLAIVANECRRMRRLRWWSVALSPQLDWSQETPINVEAIDVAKAFAHLRVGDRQILVLRYYANLSVQETADALGLTAEAAKSRIHRALRKLRPYVATDDVAEAF
ncbi:MAG: sigma-70 family RNA polymerase sigma factor [Candidatus Dormibacteraeota bacterium]|nr:sigma-70 family RNA polymerase sigma factor [Candidatus Dormibacteraeota bacterium]